jgi:chemotaxis protein methyltransferase CheR
MPGEPEAALPRAYEFTDESFRRVRQLVHAELGISLADSKRELVYQRLSRRLRALKIGDFDSYLQLIERRHGDELQNFCNAITTNLTSFFRERYHFEFLTQKLLPALERNNADTRRIRIWSAGCSSGEEAYSIAMVALETLGHLRGWDMRILATDIDSVVLEQARCGLYSGETLEKMTAARLLRWFERSGTSGQYRISDELRSLISFKRLNLVDSWPMSGPFDVIFCRNVIIYFDRDTQRGIIERMAALQRPGDYLVLGHAESLLEVSTRYRLVGQAIHRRVGP